jgi:hypothetical protein
VKAGRAINPCPPEVDSLLHESILRIGASATRSMPKKVTPHVGQTAYAFGESGPLASQEAAQAEEEAQRDPTGCTRHNRELKNSARPSACE